MKTTDSSGKATAYTYDSTGKFTKVTGKVEVSGAETDVAVQYTYGRDRLTKITHNGWEISYTYDANDCLTKEAVTTADGTRTVNRTYESKDQF